MSLLTRIVALARETVHAHLVTTCPGFEPGKNHWPTCDNAVKALLACYEKMRDAEEKLRKLRV